jgi:hypothetical protein
VTVLCWCTGCLMATLLSLWRHIRSVRRTQQAAFCALSQRTLTESFKRARCCRSRALLLVIAALPMSAMLLEALINGDGPSRLALPPRRAGMLSVLPGGREGNAPTTLGLCADMHTGLGQAGQHYLASDDTCSHCRMLHVAKAAVLRQTSCAANAR